MHTPSHTGPLTKCRPVVLQYLYDVINLNQTALANAWFEISYVKVFTVSNASLEVPISSSGSSVVLGVATTTAAPGTGGAPSASSTSTSTSSGNGADGNTSGGRNGALHSASPYAAVLSASILAVSSWALL